MAIASPTNFANSDSLEENGVHDCEADLQHEARHPVSACLGVLGLCTLLADLVVRLDRHVALRREPASASCRRGRRG